MTNTEQEYKNAIYQYKNRTQTYKFFRIERMFLFGLNFVKLSRKRFVPSRFILLSPST